MFWIIPYTLPEWVTPVHLGILVLIMLPVLHDIFEGNGSDWLHWGANARRRHGEAAPRRGAAPRAPLGRRLGGGTDNDATLADCGGGGSAGRSFRDVREDERAQRRAAADRTARRNAGGERGGTAYFGYEGGRRRVISGEDEVRRRRLARFDT